MEEKRRMNELNEAVLDQVTGGIDGSVEQLHDAPLAAEGDDKGNNDFIWLKETSEDRGTDAYYGLENPSSTFESGSKLWIKWTDK